MIVRLKKGHISASPKGHLFPGLCDVPDAEADSMIQSGAADKAKRQPGVEVQVRVAPSDAERR